MNEKTNQDSAQRGNVLVFLFQFLFASVRVRFFQHVGMALALSVGTLALGFALLGGWGVGRSLEGYLDELFPARRIMLHPRALNLLWLKVETASIVPETISALYNIEGVKRVSPEAVVRFPVYASGEIGGDEFGTDLALSGVEKWMLGEDAPEDFEYEPGSGDLLPAVVSKYFLDVYNISFAESNGLPKLTEQAVIGRHYELHLGTSTVRPVDAMAGEKYHVLKGQIVGVSKNPHLLGVAIPLNAVESFNEWYGFKDKEYRALHVELETPEALDAIEPELAGLGLILDERESPWRKAVVIIRMAGLALLGFGVIVFLLALAYMLSQLNHMLASRRTEISLMRALGGGVLQIVALLAIEIGLIGAMGIGFGVCVLYVIWRFIDHWYQEACVIWSFLPEGLFQVSWMQFASLALIGWAIMLLFALKPVLSLSRSSIVSLLNRNA